MTNRQADNLDDIAIKMLQGSSLDPCPQAAEAILSLRAEVSRLELLLDHASPETMLLHQE